MKPSLKRETVKGILTEEAFNMASFGDAEELTRKKGIPTQKGGCGTACCIAGHIVSAGRRLGLPMLTRAQATRACELREAIDYQGGPVTPAQKKLADRVLRDQSVENGDHEVDDVAIIARDPWASQYGKEEAERLDFYGRTINYSHDLEDVTAKSAVAHLRKGTPLEAPDSDDCWGE